ncbi:HutD family protein [Bradyrhizobium genosp. L]|uniref:HutD/Ves family protein n=1 Tax=Bradyrhizobium genosp. L TaxID=83637 RepID=UPI0018A253DE|nr:HutD family protein [Bradyrhizobium genosp. L]QPF87327.1 HutD family protein [Bradyrhizobium genosp. L]
MRIIRASDCRSTAWKNGGGSTTEIAVAPSGASLDNFDWRISMARVASDGPFSEFAGIDRTLAVVAGSKLALTIGDAAPIVLDSDSSPISFAGDTPTSARLTAGAITDLNVMTRRGRFAHRLLRIREPQRCGFDDGDVALAVACSGTLELSFLQDSMNLTEGDAALLTRTGDAAFWIAPTPTAKCYLVLLRECRSQAGSGYPAARASVSHRSIRS